MATPALVSRSGHLSPALIHTRLRFNQAAIRSSFSCHWSSFGLVGFKRRDGGLNSSVRAAATEMEKGWVQFPRLSPAGKQLMETMADMMDTELGTLLLPSQTADDVRSFQAGNGEGSVTLRAGREGSKIDFVLGSWLNCTLPFGALNIATLIAMLGAEADSPHLLCEFIQSGPESLVLVLDLLPRKDLVVEPEYLARFYETSKLESVRQTFEKHPQTQPYLSTALYVRSVVSPTALLYKGTYGSAGPRFLAKRFLFYWVCTWLKFFSETGFGFPKVTGNEEKSLDALIEELVQPAATTVLQTWLEGYKDLSHALDSDALAYMKKRDDLIKTKGVEVDLSANMPRLFGQEIANRVVAAFRKGV